MSEVSKDISIGNRLSKEEIEETFNTGFGYQISGINPRRDSRDRRYVLVFANEDGPYDGSVTQGRFEYIGEGLSGDQSENLPETLFLSTLLPPVPQFTFSIKIQEMVSGSIRGW